VWRYMGTSAWIRPRPSIVGKLELCSTLNTIMTMSCCGTRYFERLGNFPLRRFWLFLLFCYFVCLYIVLSETLKFHGISPNISAHKSVYRLFMPTATRLQLAYQCQLTLYTTG